MRGTRRLAAVLLSVTLGACGSNEPSSPGGTTGTSGPSGSTGTTGSNTPAPNTVSVTDNAFSPSAMTVAPGTTVTWSWTNASVHNVTFANPAVGNSGDRSGGTFQKLFNNTGSFPYECTLHAGMTGTITVAAP